MNEETKNQMKELFFILLDKYEQAERCCLDSYSTNITNDNFTLNNEIKDIKNKINNLIL